MARDSRQVENQARMLMQRLDNPNFYEYYCKVSYKLSEAEINGYLEVALKGKSPARYFTFLCNKAIKEKSGE